MAHGLRTRRFGHTPLVRGVVCVALVGYLLALGAAPTGHGLRLAAHLLAEHDGVDGHSETQTLSPERARASALEIPPHEHGEPHGQGELHGHSELQPPSPERASASEQEVQAHMHGEGPRTGASEDVHAHRGRLHSHREAPPPPALLTVALDTHCIFACDGVPAPSPAQSTDRVSPGAIRASVVVPVEVRPPQRTA